MEAVGLVYCLAVQRGLGFGDVLAASWESVAPSAPDTLDCLVSRLILTDIQEPHPLKPSRGDEHSMLGTMGEPQRHPSLQQDSGENVGTWCWGLSSSLFGKATDGGGLGLGLGLGFGSC